MTCANPECDYPANPDPEISANGFCCEKCEGRFNGEEWASGGKKKHTAFCTSHGMGDNWEPQSKSKKAKSGGWGKGPAKCKHPECEYLVATDQTYCPGYCCEKCMGLHQGADWAEGGKRHYKSCEKRTEEDAAVGGGDMFGGAFGKAAMMAMAMKGAMKGDMSAMKGLMAMKGKGGGAGGKGGLLGKGGKGGDKSLKNFSKDCKLWVGNLPAGTTFKELQDHFKNMGTSPKWAEVLKNGTTGGVAFATAEAATEAMATMAGMDLNGSVLEVDVWTGK